AFGHVADRYVDGAVNVVRVILARRSHVEQLQPSAAGARAEVGGGNLLEGSDRQACANPRIVPAGYRSVDAIESHAQQLNRGVLRVRRLVREQDDMRVSRNHPAGPVPDLRPEAEIDRAVWMSCGERAGWTKIDDDGAVCRERGGSRRFN